MGEPTREELLGMVREAYVAGDPVPGGLVSRMQAAAAVAAEESGLGLDLELMLLVESSAGAEPAGVRSSAPVETSAYTLRFAHAGVDVLVRVAADGDSSSRLDGWVVPGSPMTVRAVRADDVRAPVVAVTLGASGRFELTSLPAGLVRLRFEPADGSSTTFLTPTFEI